MAELSGIEYALLSGVADSKIRSANNQFPVPEGYTKFDVVPQNTSGLDAVAYTNGTKIVIAFGSTEMTAKDIITDSICRVFISRADCLMINT